MMMHEDYSSDLNILDGSRSRRPRKRRIVLSALLIACSGILLGFMIGWLSKPENNAPPPAQGTGPCLGETVPEKIIQDGEDFVRDDILANIDPDAIRANLEEWSSFTHMAGTEGENRLADMLYERWQNLQMDHVTKVTYEVLLSFPNEADPSLVFIVNNTADGEAIFQSQDREKVLEPTQNRSDIIPPFNAYSPAGDVTGDLIYVNYGRIDDFRQLEQEFNISVNGSIAIARYGKIFRGDKAKFAAQFGAIGLIMYTDPADYSDTSVDPYPDSWWLPDTGVQRGTVFPDNGDPLTPGYPSREYSYRLSKEETLLPTIPIHPISFGDAQQLLMRLNGTDAPGDWQGGLNITYRLGPGFNDTDLQTRLYVTSYNQLANTSNVCAYIHGSVEPDRYVVLGNHRDAWVLGAVDPTSGTASMMELSRVLMGIVRTKDWRPRRTIVFCSWGAEEYALIGSYEWVEEYAKVLNERTVAYLNVDLTITGKDSISVNGVPLLYDVIYETTRLVQSANDDGLTLYDEWLTTFPGKDVDGNPTGRPSVGILGSGSDFTAFMSFTGISSLDLRYDYDPNIYSISSYPLYHSAYETFNLVSKFMDSDFLYSAAITKVWGELARALADSYVLPMNVSAYPEALYRYTQDLEKGYGDAMKEQDIELTLLYSAVNRLTEECSSFQQRLANADRENPIEIRSFNEQMVKMERAFVDPAGIPGRPLLKHVVYAPSLNDAYVGSSFPGLVDLMFEIELAADPAARWDQVRRHLAAVTYAVHAAADQLKDPKMFS